MVYPKFDENKAQKTFDTMFGKGSFNSGMNLARQVGRTTAQAQIAKTDYTQRLKAAQKAAKDAAAASKYDNIFGGTTVNKDAAKQIDDMIKNPKKNGAYRNANSVRNDPALQAELKSRGYGVNKFVDAMYNAASGGQFKSERQYKQYTGGLNKDVAAKKKNDTSTQGLIDKYTNPTAQKNATPVAKKNNTNNNGGGGLMGLLSNIGKGLDNATNNTENFIKNSEVGKAVGSAIQTINPFDNVSSKDAINNYLNHKPTKAAKEFARGANRAVDSASLGAMSNLDKKVNNRTPYYNSQRAIGKGGGTDMITSGLGYLVPGIGAAKAVKGTMFGAKAGLTGLAKLGTIAKEGAAVGGGIGAAEVGIREALNPQDNNWKQNLAHFGLSTALGGAGDLALGGAGMALKGASSKAMKNMLPSNQSLSKSFADVLGANPERLALPEPQLRLNAPQTALPAPRETPSFNNVFRQPTGPNSPIPSMPDVMKTPLNFGRLNQANVGFGYNLKNQPKARFDLNMKQPAVDPLNRGQQYWQGRYEDFANTVSKSYDMNKMTQEGLDSAWSKFAKYDEPVSLNQVVDLAYPKGFEAPTPVKQVPPVPVPPLKQALHADQKINDAVKGFFPPERPRQPISKSGSFVDNTNLFQDMYPSNAPKTPELQPLQFKKTINPQSDNPVGKWFVITDGKGNPVTKPHRVDSVINSKGEDFVLSGNQPTPMKQVKYIDQSNVNMFFNNKTLPKDLEHLRGTVKQDAARAAQERVQAQAFLHDVIQNNPNLSAEEVLKIYNGQNFKSGFSLSDIEAIKSNGGKPSLQDALKNSLNPAKRVNPSLIDNAKPGSVSINPMKDNGGPLIDTASVNDMQKIKDFNTLQKGTNNIYQTAERLPKPQRDRIVTALDSAKKANIDHQEKLTNDVYDKIVKGLGIGKGTKESALVQDYGEKTIVKRYLKKRGIDPSKLSPEELNAINLRQLKKSHPNDWEKIVKADNYFRNQYNQLIDQVNAVRKQVYPNSPEKLVPKRTDYYHHFQQLDGFEGFKNLFDTPANIDPRLEGISPFTKPKAKFQGFMQKRGNGKYESDAVGGFLKYAQASSHSINIDPVIPVLRNTANEIANATVDTKNANNIIGTLNNHANDLAGKTNPYDRSFQEGLGRKTIAVTSWINSRVKSNMILANLGSVLGQAGNIPLGIGKAKLHSVSGLKDTVNQSVKEILSGDKSAPVYKSDFLKERFSDQLYRRFDQKLIDQPKKLAVWMMETVDKASTRFIWNSMYSKGVKQKVINPMKYADSETRKIVAGRGVGEVPLLQKSKVVQVLAPFTLEVGNQWRVLGDMVGKKDAAGIITFLVASYGLNKAMEQVRGSGVSFDPLDALIDGYNNYEGDITGKLGAAAGSLAGETIGNIPGGNLLTNAVNTDNKIPLTDTKIKDLFGDRNPNRFGSGLTLSKAIKDPLYLIPFGASQLRKSSQGIDAAVNGGVYKGDNNVNPFSKPKSELMYPIETSPLKNLQLGLMGPSSTSEAREYYGKKQQPLKEKNTAIFKAIRENGGNANQFVKDTRTKSKLNSLVKKLKEVDKDKKMSDKEKQDKARTLIKQLQDLKK